LSNQFFRDEYIEKIRELDNCAEEQLKSKAEDYDSIYFSKVCRHKNAITNFTPRKYIGKTQKLLGNGFH
jgi:hypothetical protein